MAHPIFDRIFRRAAEALSMLEPKNTLVGLAGQKAWHIWAGDALPRINGKYRPSQLRTQKAGPEPAAFPKLKLLLMIGASTDSKIALCFSGRVSRNLSC